MRAVIDLPELAKEAADQKALYEFHGIANYVWHKEISEPRPEWHGKEVTVIGNGVFRFDGSSDYHLINPAHLKPCQPKH
jgi:hypothetical protein